MKLRTAKLFILVWFLMVPGSPARSQEQPADSLADMLERRVPQVFQSQLLLLQSFSDSSWQVLRGDSLLSTSEVFDLMGASEELALYRSHQENVDRLNREVWEAKLISVGGTIGGGFYAFLRYEDGWIQTIPGVIITAFAIWKWFDGQVVNQDLQREIYFLNNIMPPSKVQRWVDQYNLELYQLLSNETIHFRPQP